MGKIIRHDVSEELAAAGLVEAGDFVFLTFCCGNVDQQSVEAQINGAFDHMTARLASVGLPLASVVKIDVMLRDAWNIPLLEKVLRERFPEGQYPARKTIQTEFAHEGLHIQIDAIAYREK